MPSPAFFRQLGILTLPDFLDSEYRLNLCRLIEGAPTEKASVVAPHKKGHLDLGARRTDCCVIPKETRSGLRHRLLEIQPDLEEHFGVRLAGCEAPQCLVYNPGDFFKAHQDAVGCGVEDFASQRSVSVVIFLNRHSQDPEEEDTYGGGDFVFYGLLDGAQWEKCAFPLKPEPGLLVAFPSDKWHEVKPVSHGRRYTVVTWFHTLRTDTSKNHEGGLNPGIFVR